MTNPQIITAVPNISSEIPAGARFPGAAVPFARNPSSQFARDVLSGLSLRQKMLPSKYLYDDFGSEIFKAICEQPEYYPTRIETALLERSVAEIAELTGGKRPLIEFGSGASRKTRILLDAMPQIRRYVPIDISLGALTEASRSLSADFPGLRVDPLHEDFTRISVNRHAMAGLAGLGFFPGSTIGNFTPSEATTLLAGWRRLLGRGSQLLLGIDLLKDPATLIRAYDDAVGVTAAFNLNLLARINRELRGSFSTARFEHRSVWNAESSRIEMHLVSLGAQVVEIGQIRVTFEDGETIHTESSYKYDVGDFTALAQVSGWEIERGWLSHEPSYALILFKAA